VGEHDPGSGQKRFRWLPAPNRGIGREACRQFAGRGHIVVLTAARSADATQAGLAARPRTLRPFAYAASSRTRRAELRSALHGTI
jgi:NAD(P)-dependent dehydrogenase (short-subunit alcohol dehydrogenase family)